MNRNRSHQGTDTMTRHTLTTLAAAMALSACAPPLDAPSRGTDRPSDIPTRSTAMSHDRADLMGQVQRNLGPACVSFDGGWGDALQAYKIAQQMNMRLTCIELMPGATAISAGVIIARQTRFFKVPDRNAKLFGLHNLSIEAANTPENLAALWGPNGYNAPGCRAWYDAQKPIRNQIIYVSWNFMERGCK